MVREASGVISADVERSLAFEAPKRLLDIVASLVGLIVASPLLLAIAVLVKLTSPGPVFYWGVRTGRHGVPFRIYKFRTMIVGADTGAGTTSRGDPRVTPLGRVIRRWKLDEFPQLLNVLVGNMSLVGPRPELPRYTDQYAGEEQYILSVRPGITDYSSIEFADLNERIGDADPDRDFERLILPRKNALRLKYVRERSLWVDVKIIARTLARIVRTSDS